MVVPGSVQRLSSGLPSTQISWLSHGIVLGGVAGVGTGWATDVVGFHAGVGSGVSGEAMASVVCSTFVVGRVGLVGGVGWCGVVPSEIGGRVGGVGGRVGGVGGCGRSLPNELPLWFAGVGRTSASSSMIIESFDGISIASISGQWPATHRQFTFCGQSQESLSGLYNKPVAQDDS